jgi:hypothetical protein
MEITQIRLFEGLNVTAVVQDGTQERRMVGVLSVLPGEYVRLEDKVYGLAILEAHRILTLAERRGV